MAYQKTNWVNNETPINATNLNNIENGIEGNENSIEQVNTDINSKIGDLSNLETFSITDLVSAINSQIEMTIDTSLANTSRTSIKFSNGLLINIVKKSYSNVAVNTSWGGVYASSTNNGIAYLTPFTEVYSVDGTSLAVANNHWAMFISAGNVTTTPAYNFIRGSSGTASGSIQFIAIGKWK